MKLRGESFPTLKRKVESSYFLSSLGSGGTQKARFRTLWSHQIASIIHLIAHWQGSGKRLVHLLRPVG